MKEIISVVIFLTLFIFLVTGNVLANQKMVIVDYYNMIDAEPGEVVADSISVRNPADIEAKVEIWVQDWKTTVQNGRIVKSAVEGAGVLKQSLAPYLELRSPTEMTIPPKETKYINFITEVPKEKKGSYWTAIVVSQYFEQPEEEEKEIKPNKGKIKVDSRVAFFSKIIRSNEKNDNLKPWISYLSKPEKNENGLIFKATLENRGKVAFFYPCELIIYKGLEKDENPIVKVNDREAITREVPFYLFPKEDLELKLELPVNLPPGVYTAKLKIQMERGEYAPVAWREFRVKE